ncbi:MAG: hypothetical protein JXA97_02635 [Anaerolineales bacterium]|nr:hypothetical protein [Anaerolineales bacterium]
MRKKAPVWTLFFLAPVIGELLSGSAPPVEFFKPFSLLLLSALYGSGALLAREISLAWEKRWPTIFMLGLAYGILEEGLMVKSFFDPTWMDLGLLGVYGRAFGVNWVWSLFLTIYHAVFSISIPIYLTELLYPNAKDERWLTKRGIRNFSILLGADVLFAFFLLTPYRPPFLPYAGAVLLVPLLVWTAHRMPMRWWGEQGGNARGAFWFFLIGAMGSFGLFLANWALPEQEVPVLITLAVCAALPFILRSLVRWLSGDGAWSERQRLALVSGGMSFLIFSALIAESDLTRVDNPAGMRFVGLIAIAALIALRVAVGRRESRAEKLKAILPA